MEAVRPTAAIHHTPGKFVDDDHFVIFDDVIGIALEHHIGFERLVKMMHDLRIFIIIQVAADQKARTFEQALRLFGAIFSQHHAALFLVLLIIAFIQLENDFMDGAIQF